MSVDKRVKYDVQGGVKNYLGKQKEVKAPLKWQSSPDHPTTELAYITEAEKDLLVKQDLHGSLKGGVNRGPSGIMSLNGWGSTDEGQNVSGAAASAAESGINTSDTLAAGMSNQDVKDFQSAAINAGAGQRVNPGFFDSRNVISPYELNLAKLYAKRPDTPFAKQAMRNTRGGGLGQFLSSGGIFGNLLRGLGQTFGLGKKYNEPTYDMSRLSGLPYGGSAAFENLDIRDKFNRTVEDIDTVDKEVKEKYNNYLLDAPPNPLTFEQFKGALENISMPDTAALPNEGILQVAEVLPNTVRQLKNLGIFKQGQKSTYTDKDELRMLVPSLNNATDEELDQIIAGTFKV